MTARRRRQIPTPAQQDQERPIAIIETPTGKVAGVILVLTVATWVH